MTKKQPFLHFRRPVESDAGLLLDWRTAPGIARHMFTDVTHDLERQTRWLRDASARDDYRHFIIESDGQAIGYLSYSRIDFHNLRCVPGFYVGVHEKRVSAASYLHWFIMDYAFHGMGMNKVISEVLDTNTQIIRSLRLLKETEIGIMRQHIRKDDGWHDVYLFELLREEWERQPRLFPQEQTLAAFD